ncbi:hypothetical protein KXW37_003240 [Aspergillus fumigatus]|nr:hypothetical protein KXW37_003240 [Aspergillus fumigatus]
MQLQAVLFLIGTFLASAAQGFDISPLELQFPLLHQLRLLEDETGASLHLTSLKEFVDHNFSVPIDHFHNESRYEPHTRDHFNLRYWFDASHYKEGGPVFLIAAGETNGRDRFPFLSHGIPGLEHLNLTADAVPWIGYGGSYAGAFVAFLRKVYPEVFFGVVSSSGVTEAIVDYWQYYEPIRQFAPSDCIWSIETFMDIVDTILIEHAKNETLKSHLKAVFGATSSDVDDEFFAAALSSTLGAFQGRNWDPAVGDGTFQRYCKNLTSPSLLYQQNNTMKAWTEEVISATKYDATNSSLVTGMLNYAGYMNATMFSHLDEVRGTSSHKSPQSLQKSSGVSWGYQVCTEWGYFMPGSSVPKDRLPLISRLITLAGESRFCKEDFNITTPPDTDRINKHGGFNFSYPRAAIIDGLADPWRDATPHADGTRPRQSTDEEPFILVDVLAEDVWDGIRGAVHHWDQNGLSEQDVQQGKTAPKAIVALQQEIIRFVGVWLKQWRKHEDVSDPTANTAVRNRQLVL